MTYDTWEKTEHALAAARKLVFLLCEEKPPSTKKHDSPEEILWEARMTEGRQWCIDIHNRRIALNMKLIARD